jgi:uncharacterized protein (TIGR03083 family)
LADLMQLAVDERTELADLLDTLAPEEWQRPSLCEDWTVRDVVAHVISYEEVGWLGLVGAFVRGGFGPRRVNKVRLAAYQQHTPDQLIEVLRSHLRPHGLTAGFGGGIGLSDSLIHQQDIRRPLQRPRAIAADRLVAALDTSLRAPVLPSKKNAAGLRLAPTDLDWTHGDGPEVTGTAEAILMACAGRLDYLGDLSGPGVRQLEERVARP